MQRRAGRSRWTTCSSTAPPGLGKTTLAGIVAAEMGVSLRATSGPAIARPGDLAGILTTLESGDVLFIDEIHRLPRGVEEMLYPAMEDFALDLMIGKGPGARSVRLAIKPFTLIGATTRYAMIGSPLRDRFGAVHRLDFYTVDDLVLLLAGNARRLAVEVAPERRPGAGPQRARHAAHRQPAAAPGARLRAGQGGGSHHDAGGGSGAGAPAH